MCPDVQPDPSFVPIPTNSPESITLPRLVPTPPNGSNTGDPTNDSRRSPNTHRRRKPPAKNPQNDAIFERGIGVLLDGKSHRATRGSEETLDTIPLTPSTRPYPPRSAEVDKESIAPPIKEATGVKDGYELLMLDRKMQCCLFKLQPVNLTRRFRK